MLQAAHPLRSACDSHSSLVSLCMHLQVCHKQSSATHASSIKGPTAAQGFLTLLGPYTSSDLPSDNDTKFSSLLSAHVFASLWANLVAQHVMLQRTYCQGRWCDGMHDAFCEKGTFAAACRLGLHQPFLLLVLLGKYFASCS